MKLKQNICEIVEEINVITVQSSNGSEGSRELLLLSMMSIMMVMMKCLTREKKMNMQLAPNISKIKNRNYPVSILLQISTSLLHHRIKEGSIHIPEEEKRV